MSEASISLVAIADDATRDESQRKRTTAIDSAQLRALVDREHAFVWRSLRRLGVTEADVDDGVQKVFLVAHLRIGAVAAGRERAFLFATCMRVAANERRARSRRRSDGPLALDSLVSAERSPEHVAADRRLLDAVLEPLPLPLRSVLVLFELEQMTKEEIASLLDLPEGTVASRLRRARDQALAVARRLRAAKGEQQ